MGSTGEATQRPPHTVRRRSLLAGLGAGASVALAGGCARGDSTAPQPGTTSLANDNATWDEGYLKAGRELKKLTGFALRPLSNPNPTAYTQVTQISLQTTKATDLIKWASGFNLKQLARTGQLSDLSTMWAGYESKGWVTPPLRDAMSYRGSVYGIPLYQSYYVLFYNKEVFRSAASGPRRPGRSCCTARRSSRKQASRPSSPPRTATGPRIEWFQELVSKVDPHFYTDLIAGKAHYTDPRPEGDADLARLHAQGLDDRCRLRPERGPAALKTGKVGMFLHGSWQSQGLAATGMKPGVDFDAFMMPPVDPPPAESVITESGVSPCPAEPCPTGPPWTTSANWLNPEVQRVWTDFLQDGSANPTTRPGNPVVAHLQQRVQREHWTPLPRYGESAHRTSFRGTPTTWEPS